jgi:CHAD domain-containing protein
MASVTPVRSKSKRAIDLRKSNKPARPSVGAAMVSGQQFTLRSSMTSEQAFCALGLRYLASMADHRDATSRGEPAALHKIRVAITCLRTAIAFFSPMVAGAQWRRLRRELKWLNGHLGAARDFDVVLRQLDTGPGRKREGFSPRLKQKWSASHARVTKALRSHRYDRLIEGLTDWIQNGQWRRSIGTELALARRTPVMLYAARKLDRWSRQMLRKSRKLADMDADARHRLRIRTKRVRYAMEWFGDMLPGATPERQLTTLKQLRRAQNALGALNDAERTKDLVRPLKKQRERPRHPDRHKRLTRAAAYAFGTLGQVAKRA